jgi:hypothetical protein
MPSFQSVVLYLEEDMINEVQKVSNMQYIWHHKKFQELVNKTVIYEERATVTNVHSAYSCV